MDMFHLEVLNVDMMGLLLYQPVSQSILPPTSVYEINYEFELSLIRSDSFFFFSLCSYSLFYRWDGP